MALLTTLNVRSIMRKNGCGSGGIYTNRYGKTGTARTVKCYYCGNASALAALQAACGEENVKLTAGSKHFRSWGEGITVKCVLA
jgi:hypothetical protein